MADQLGFSLPSSSYKELIKIIQGYGQVSGETTPSDVARVIAIHETIVSANNKFLVAVGIVQGGKRKTMTSVGRDLALALEHDREDEISRLWRAIADSAEFLQKIVAAVRIRKGMDESSLEAHVAYSAGQPKTPRTLAGAGTIVQILRVAGLLKEEGGNLVAAAPEVLKAPEPQEELTSSTPSSSAPTTAASTTMRATGSLNLNIEVRVQCTPQDLDGLGQKLRKMLKEFNQQESTNGSESGEQS